MRSTVFHVLLGIAAGIIMALVELLLLIPVNFSVYSVNLIVAVVFGAVYPWCLRFLNKWSDHVWLVQFISVGIAAGIVLLYGIYMMDHMIMGNLPFSQIAVPCVLVNGAALVSALVFRNRSK